MREPTKEEIEGVNRYVKSISKPTGKNFNDLIDEHKCHDKCKNYQCCDKCKNYHWYYDHCDKWNCEVYGRSVYDCFED